MLVSLVFSSEIKNRLFSHVIVPELLKYQIRIPREILGLNDGLNFSLARKLKS